ncbi:DUF4166 domain-containing protein [Antrihabitans cavernicola]|uniref:DUF4166 domain-containing protein n=2 Tax=Antrihabitans cavernicola TaxID=2495913 RepID=A0A5A7SIL5_9NOCA|nr:DUF4166 domain-containing protein [Spelaeibacter cavernicola]
MTSVVAGSLGSDFSLLHPKVAWRFGFSSADDVCQIGTGVMEEISATRLLPAPVLRIGARRGLFPPGVGANVPFTIANYAYRDTLGREVLAFGRRFAFPGRTGILNSLMVTGTDSALDYLGNKPDMVVHTSCSVGEDGALLLHSDPPRVLTWPFTIRAPAVMSAITEAREGWDETNQRHTIEVSVRSPAMGELLSYRGWFTAVAKPCTREEIPAELIPAHIESRE